MTLPGEPESTFPGSCAVQLIPMPFAGLLETMMAGKFEWQFKYRDEADVNAATRRARGEFKKSPIDGHFCDSSDSVYPHDFRTTITITRGGGALWRFVVTRVPAAPRVAGDSPRGPPRGAGACSLETPKLKRRRRAGAPVFWRRQSSVGKLRRAGSHGRSRAMTPPTRIARRRRTTTTSRRSPAFIGSAATSRSDQ